MLDTTQLLLQALASIKEDIGEVNKKARKPAPQSGNPATINTDGIEQKKEREKEKEIIPGGIVDNISGIIFLIQKIRKYDEPRTIGFFGGQNRGKSSLINQLLGCDLMPVGPIPLSSVVIKVKHEANHAPGTFSVEVIDRDKHLDTQEDVDLKQAQMLLTQYGSHRGGGLSDNVDTITVTSNFENSNILKHGGILVDTPGAEVALDAGEASAANKLDLERAIKILKDMHIVIFVERANYIEGATSRQFFTEYLKFMRPLSVVNCKDDYSLPEKELKSLPPDKYEEGKQRSMKKFMLRTFGMNLDRILCVSSKEAVDARKSENKKLWEQSNVPALEKRIESELRNLSPETGLKTCLIELKKSLEQIHQINPDVAREIFRRAQRPFFVMRQSEQNAELAKLVGDLYEQYK